MSKLPAVQVGVGAPLFNFGNLFATTRRAVKATAAAISPVSNRVMAPCPRGLVRAPNGQCVSSWEPRGQAAGGSSATRTTNLPARYVSGPPQVGMGAPALMPDPVGNFMKSIMEQLKMFHAGPGATRAKNARPQFTTMVKRS